MNLWIGEKRTLFYEPELLFDLTSTMQSTGINAETTLRINKNRTNECLWS